MNEVIYDYIDTSGAYHLIISSGNKTGDVIEYVTLKTCPFCNRELTEDMVCKCGKNNAVIRI